MKPIVRGPICTLRCKCLFSRWFRRELGTVCEQPWCQDPMSNLATTKTVLCVSGPHIKPRKWVSLCVSGPHIKPRRLTSFFSRIWFWGDKYFIFNLHGMPILWGIDERGGRIWIPSFGAGRKGCSAVCKHDPWVMFQIVRTLHKIAEPRIFVAVSMRLGVLGLSIRPQRLV